METLNSSGARRVSWNKGRLTGQKPPLKLREIWAIRTRLQMSSNARELALFNLAIDKQASGVRSNATAGAGRLHGRSCRSSRDFHAAKNAQTSAV